MRATTEDVAALDPQTRGKMLAILTGWIEALESGDDAHLRTAIEEIMASADSRRSREGHPARDSELAVPPGTVRVHPSL